jgi:N-acetylglucosamine kinase-like BadF-type ATPase
VTGDRVVLAIDGGNSKTDVALVGEDGGLLGHARGPLSSPHHLGLDRSVELLQLLVDEARGLAGADGSHPVTVAEVFLAGVDFPAEEDALYTALASRDWAAQIEVGNDTLAVLRAGTERGWGVAVVCGAGINCVGVAPDGRRVRFPALGRITGDWGGGYDVGLEALFAAARGEDGRGPQTSLEQAVPRHFGLDLPSTVAEEIHAGRLPQRRMIELAPVVMAEAGRDEVAAGIVAHLADEIVALARATLIRLRLERVPVEVVLGGGLLRSGDVRLHGAIADGLASVGPAITIRTTSAPPVVGAALHGLDRLGASDDAKERVRFELTAAVDAEPHAVPVGAAADAEARNG